MELLAGNSGRRDQINGLTYKYSQVPSNDSNRSWANVIRKPSFKVPNRWWYGYTDGCLNDGRIGEFHASTELWDLILDDSSWGIFGINYEALYQYADESSSTYEDY